jgi:hypothetical protein
MDQPKETANVAAGDREKGYLRRQTIQPPLRATTENQALLLRRRVAGFCWL